MRRVIVTLTIAFLLASITGFFPGGTVQAHRMLIAYQVGRIDVKVYTEDRSPVTNAHVKVYKPDGTFYTEGKTNETGEFSFEPTVMKGDWKVVAEGLVAQSQALIRGWEGTAANPILISYRVGRVDIKVYYGGGGPAGDTRIEVYKPDATLYQEGKTDNDGKFSFELGLMKGEWRAVAESMGHRQEIAIGVWAEPTEAEVPPDGGKSPETGVPAGTERPTDMQATTEMPLYTRILAGFGYLIGLAGMAVGYMGWRARKRGQHD